MEGRETNTRRLLEVLSERVQVEEIRKRMVEQVGSSLRLVVGSGGCVVIDVRDVTREAVREGDTKTEVDATLEMSDDGFALVCAGKLSPQHAFMTGRLMVKGNMLRAMKSDPLFRLLRPSPPASSGRLKQLPSARL